MAVQSVESRRKNQRRYLKAIRQIKRIEKCTWRQAQTIYRDGIMALGLKHRPKKGVPVRDIIRAAKQPALFQRTTWIGLYDVIVANIDAGKKVFVDFGEWEGGPVEHVPRERAMRIVRLIRNAGDRRFKADEEYQDMEKNSQRGWTDYWRVLEELGVLLYPGRVEIFWAPDYQPWERIEEKSPPNISGGALESIDNSTN